MDIQKLKGFRDILPGESDLWRRTEASAIRVLARYGFEELRLPLLEETALFRRSIGEATDIVEKEMYTFVDTGGTSVTLRPEGTASAVRAYIENGLARSETKSKLYYLGPMFRRERPQKGRLRQFHQVGAECFGWAQPEADADLLCLAWDLFRELDLLDKVSLQINSLGCREDRPRYVQALRAYLEPKAGDLCENCQRRLVTNPLRVIDCKSPRCGELVGGAPSILDSLCGDCSAHFDRVRTCLDLQRVPYAVNPRMVRGLDYYTRTTFELLSTGLGAQNAVAAGGRYDGLVELLGGPPTPALGFAAGLERLTMLLGAEGASRPGRSAYLIHQGAGALDSALLLRRELLNRGIDAEIDYEPRSFKAQLRAADRKGARFALILGEDEVARDLVTWKDLKQGTQELVSREEAVNRTVAGTDLASR